jgi:transcriptional regulator with XRE-family HTH domain
MRRSDRRLSDFGRWLQRHLDRVDMNASGLAARMGIKHPSVLAWMYGDSQPTDENRRKLAAVLGVPIDEVYQALGMFPAPESVEELPPELRRLIHNYQQLTPERQRMIEAALDSLLASQTDQLTDDD